jgi:hypothetical protein
VLHHPQRTQVAIGLAVDIPNKCTFGLSRGWNDI